MCARYPSTSGGLTVGGALCCVLLLAARIDAAELLPSGASVRKALIEEKGREWPTFGGDNLRSGVSISQIRLPLREAWQYRDETLDGASFDLVAANRSVYFGSEAGRALTSLDAETGRRRWSFSTGGPVRLAPTVFEGRVFFGSDDGHVYSVEGITGKLLWRFDVGRAGGVTGAAAMRVVVRTGVAVDAGRAYFGSAVAEAVGAGALTALDAGTGSLVWHRPGVPCGTGHIVTTRHGLFLPQDGAGPAAYRKHDGSLAKASLRDGGEGGSFVGVIDDLLIYGPDAAGLISLHFSESREVSSFREVSWVPKEGTVTLHGRRLLSRANTLVLLRERELMGLEKPRLLESLKSMFSRSFVARQWQNNGDAESAPLNGDARIEASTLWKTEAPADACAILVGATIFCAGEGLIEAFDVDSGRKVWSASVAGCIVSMGIAEDRLFAGSDRGMVYAFTSAPETE